jgi:hypothetical protein
MNVVAEMLLTEPALPAIWAGLILLSFPAMLLLGSPNVLRNPLRAAREAVAALRDRGVGRRQLAEVAAESARLADEVRVAADRAASNADRWQQLWQQSTDELGAAWQAWLDADARLRTGLVAAGWGTPWSVPTCAEYASRERFLHRAVTAAADRGELPADAIADAQAGRNGWDARLHPVEQELVIARTSAAWLRHCYETAVAAERAAWHDADLARRTSDSLRHEATTTTAAAARHAGRLPARARIEIRTGRQRLSAAAV